MITEILSGKQHRCCTWSRPSQSATLIKKLAIIITQILTSRSGKAVLEGNE